MRLSSHRHAVDRAVRALAGQGQLVVQEVAAPDRLGRPRVGLAIVPSGATGPSTLPRFSGEALRRARLRAGVTVAALASELGVTWSAVRWWERAAAVPPARGREIIEGLARLQRQAAPHRPVSVGAVRRLREARAAIGWSQARLASALGVSQSTVSKWESGKGLTVENARRMHRLLSRMPPNPQLDSRQLRELRGRCGWTQIELARRAGVGVATLRRWEAGRTPVPAHRSRELTALLQA